MMTHRHPITRRTLMRGAAAAFGLTPALAQNAGNWPDHAVRSGLTAPRGPGFNRSVPHPSQPCR